MGACGGRECGGGPELPAQGKQQFDAWLNGAGKDTAASKDSTALTAWALIYKRLTHRMLTEETTDCKPKALHSVTVVGPAGSHYHFDVDCEHPDYNKGHSRSIVGCAVKNGDGAWETDFPCQHGGKA